MLDDYVEILARVHRIPVDALGALGIELPADARSLGLADFDLWETAYRQQKVRPDPAIEFLTGWVRRHVPTHRERASLICADSGQFLFDDGRVTALLDLELATLGDPMADLAGMLSRDLSEPMGDLAPAFHRYAECAGDPIDRDAIDFHAVRFCVVTPLAVAHLVAAPPTGIDFIQYLAWYCVWLRAPLEIIAARLGVELPAVPEPEPEPSWLSPAHDALRAMLAPADGADAFADYERDVAARVAEYTRRAERYGAALEADDLDEVASLLGWRPGSWAEADSALESLVSRAGPELDAGLARCFQRRIQRIEFLLRPVLRELSGAKIQILD